MIEFRNNTTFFHELPAMQTLKQITNPDYYVDAPADWYIAITDVVNSTIAIEAGRYKQVNTVAAVTITAVLNSIPNTDVPFMFGGDGASIMFPPYVEKQVREALAAIKTLARDVFELEVRAGIIPVKDVLDAGYAIKVGKIHTSDNFQQPVFTGGGLDYADTLLKSPMSGKDYEVDDNPNAEANFDGYECRWSKHPAASSEVVSLLIKASSHDEKANTKIYDQVINKITDIYGDADERHPFSVDKMSVSTTPTQYFNETGWKTHTRAIGEMLKLMFWAIGGYFLWKYVDKIWDKYVAVVHSTTDHEKFDDMLRMTISGTPEQRAALREFLDIYVSMGELAYGVHTADHSLMTCLVFDRFGRQVHFVDADRGGYAM
ncbi:MAG: DUF3095 domain-containing protein, partial [Chloroflexota bacterium]